MKAKDEFAWVPHKIDINIKGLSIITVSNFDEIIRSIPLQANPDKFVYPPIVELYNRFLDNSPSQEAYPNSEREAPKYCLPITHSIEVDLFEDEKQNFEILELIVNYIGFVFGYRTHLESKPLDRRFYTISNSDHSIPTCDWLRISILELVDFWRDILPKNQISLNNLLFLHNRGPVYEWTWEYFLIEYQVFDSLWKIGRDNNIFEHAPHCKRIYKVCNKYKMMIENNTIDGIVTLRNDLFHEALWDKNDLFIDSDSSMRLPLYLRKLNQRFLFALLGYTGGYIKSPWNAHVKHLFYFDD